MFGIFKKFFYDPNQESIDIFERATKIEYDSKLFLSLNVLSITNSKLKNLVPLSVFTNVETLNLAHNNISDISPLESLKYLKIIDLRFNEIKDIPSWIYKLDKPIYWERVSEENEGIYLEGNPLSKETILKIKNRQLVKPFEIDDFTPEQGEVKAIISQSDKNDNIDNSPKTLLKIDDLEPLNTQHIAIFLPQNNNSTFIAESVVDNLLLNPSDMRLHINISFLEYSDDDTILNPKQQIFNKLLYIIVILKDRECCIHPHLLESIIKNYSSSKLFLLMEGEQSNIKDKINFFKRYNQSNSILEVFHSFDSKSNEEIKNKFFTYMQLSQEVNSLWKKEWIELKKIIENREDKSINFEEFQILADDFSISKENINYIFTYLKRVGSIKEYMIE